jgi:uncharacterized protein (DUF111 family)
VTKRPLPRGEESVRVDGHEVRVKISRFGDGVAHVSVEFDDVLRVARATGQPAKRVLGMAQALADAAYRPR